MAYITREYKRITEDISVSRLSHQQTGKVIYRHRYRKSGHMGGLGKQIHKDYPEEKFESFEEFKAYIIKKFNYD